MWPVSSQSRTEAQRWTSVLRKGVEPGTTRQARTVSMSHAGIGCILIAVRSSWDPLPHMAAPMPPTWFGCGPVSPLAASVSVAISRPAARLSSRLGHLRALAAATSGR